MQEMLKMFGNKPLAKMMVNNMKFDKYLKCLGYQSNPASVIENMVTMKGYHKFGEYKGPFMSVNAGKPH